MYQPFTKMWFYFADIIVDELGTNGTHFPTITTENENIIIAISDHGYRAPFSSIAISAIPNLHLLATTDIFQCFPYYSYAEDGSNRHENITEWALSQFHVKYGSEVTKWDIFHYIYAMLHHSQYRERYAENLKRDLPHIPLLYRQEAFLDCVRIGQQLMDIHLHYEQRKESPVRWSANQDVPFSCLV